MVAEHREARAVVAGTRLGLPRVAAASHDMCCWARAGATEASKGGFGFLL